ncbi:4-hydroxy-3-methylbut-2-enyl diphosphate reductase [candidate division KSB1 bacterium]|nr:4-hydroxy-3-methylbut-2-enyl diphosphate reductase [candidate division KSB1 bacterium]
MISVPLNSMNVTIESKARPCPGVERAITMAEDALRHGSKVFSIGEMIHNRREIDRLKKLGLYEITAEKLTDPQMKSDFEEASLLIRAHGEPQHVIDLARSAGLKIINATCPIVTHSQTVVDQHVEDGWGIFIVGKPDHPEVIGLMDRTRGNGMVISSLTEAKNADLEERTLLLAQSTANPDLFHDICKLLSSRISGLKIMDTTCRFIRTRQKDIQGFVENKDIVLVIGGKKSSNCRLLYEKARILNEQTYRLRGPDDIDWTWFKDGERVGVTGGASTPKWQLEEIRSSLENHKIKKNPKGLKNSKGGKFLWWMRKNPK